MIPVTRPLLPDSSEYTKELESIWAANILTNHGPKVRELESLLSKFLGVDQLQLIANGTLALHLALRALGPAKKVLTTPFSFVATTSSIVWEGMEPVFVDVKQTDLTIDEDLVEAALEKDKSIGIILATHVYGFACNVVALDRIAKKYNVKVIYDAAHAFGVQVDGQSILSFGDASVLSFHATKVFHTVEGGGIYSRSREITEAVRLIRNFGHLTPETFSGLGTNAKMSEFHAAMGLCVLKLVEDAIERRKKITNVYDTILKSKAPSLTYPQPSSNCTRNYAYYPLICTSESQLMKIKTTLEDLKVTTRRYFYPSLNNLPYVKKYGCPISEDISRRILCLPLYPDLSLSQAEWIASEVVKNACD